MTREWFEDNIDDFESLIEFCEYHGCDVLDGIHPEDDFDQYVCDDIRNATRSDYWTEIRDELNRIYDEQCGDYFLYNARFDYVWISSDYDFAGYKDKVIDWAEYGDFFEPEYEDDEFEDDNERLEDEPTREDNNFDTPDLMLLFGDQ